MVNETDIEKYYNNAALLQQTLAQIEKDFAMSDVVIDIDVKDKLSYEQLFNIVSDRLILLMKQSDEKLNNLLYRIDISIQQVKKYSHANIDKPLNEVLAEIIIKRELQKVVLRNFYK